MSRLDASPDVNNTRQSYEGIQDDERDLFLPSSLHHASSTHLQSNCPCSQGKRFGTIALSLAFLGGLFCSYVAQKVLFSRQCNTHNMNNDASNVFSSPPLATSTLFPSDVGYAGGTSTGVEAAIVATALSYPLQTGAAQLVVSQNLSGGKPPSTGFDILKHWGNLSPWYSVGSAAFGLPDTSPDPPKTCRVIGLHLLHRHGARYPATSSNTGPAGFAKRLSQSRKKWNAKENLAFLNEWTYKLGAEVLTPFGRQQMYDLGVSTRLKYGFLLNNFTESNTRPVFRTESQDRMLKSAINFALGFFGYPIEEQYHQSIMIEAPGFNNSLAPYYKCTNSADKNKGGRGHWYMERWKAIYLKDALPRLQSQIDGYAISVNDAYEMQEMCAYETVALGYSKFCALFTEDEWKGYNYAIDLNFWYKSAFGSPVARAQGIGWVQELVSRLSHSPITTHDSSTNSTLDDNPVTFPLHQSLYVDATHEVVVLNVLTALNLTNFARSGPLPYDHVPDNRSFRSSELAPFGTNVQFQLLDCVSPSGPQIRIVINDGVTPLTGIKGCPEQKDGMCPLAAFIAAQKERINEVEWDYECQGKWEVPEGPAWVTTSGAPPLRWSEARFTGTG